MIVAAIISGAAAENTNSNHLPLLQYYRNERKNTT